MDAPALRVRVEHFLRAVHPGQPVRLVKYRVACRVVIRFVLVDVPTLQVALEDICFFLLIEKHGLCHVG